MNLSIVIPLLNEAESLQELHDWIEKIMQSNHFLYEILFIDDGSTDDSWNVITFLAQQNPNVKGLQFHKNYGKSQALHAGFKTAKGDVIITMDADLQDNPQEIPELYKLITEENYDLISGWKKKRYDAILSKNLPSKLFNWAARRTSGVQLHDFNCGLKAFKKEVVKTIEVSGDMHRYIPVLAKNAGYSKIGEKIVQHQARKYGKTKFGMERFIKGFLDLITIWFVSKFGKRPMHLFGALGVVMFLIGLGLALYLGIDKLFIHPTGRLLTSRAHFFIALTAMIMGTQLFLAGFIGEILIRSKKDTPQYTIKDEINLSRSVSDDYQDQYSS